MPLKIRNANKQKAWAGAEESSWYLTKGEILLGIDTLLKVLLESARSLKEDGKDEEEEEVLPRMVEQLPAYVSFRARPRIKRLSSVVSSHHFTIHFTRQHHINMGLYRVSS